jgi:serine/threonine protein kinase
MGTAGYKWPEQVRGQQVDHRSDIFSFGAILYEMLSGRRAFVGDSAAGTMSAILREAPPEQTVSRPNAPLALHRIAPTEWRRVHRSGFNPLTIWHSPSRPVPWNWTPMNRRSWLDGG